MRGGLLILAVDMGGTNWKAAVMSQGQPLSFGSMPNRSNAEDLPVLARLFDELLEKADGRLAECIGLGVSLPEIVDSDNKTCPSRCYKYPYLQGKNIESVLRDYIDLPVSVDNDARAALLGEEVYGVFGDRPGGSGNLLIVTLGTGIGVAARVNGKLLRGAHGIGSTMGGHITVDLNGPVCQCGNRGCAEALASGWAFAARAPEQDWFSQSTLADSINPTFKMLTDAVRKGDAHAKTGLSFLCDVWASLLVSLVHLLDPAQIVLSGGFLQSADLYLDALTDAVRRRVWDTHAMPEFYVAEDPALSGLRGCEVLVRRAAT